MNKAQKSLIDTIKAQGSEAEVGSLAREITKTNKSKAQQGRQFWTRLPSLLRFGPNYPSWEFYELTGKISWPEMCEFYAKSQSALTDDLSK